MTAFPGLISTAVRFIARDAGKPSAQCSHADSSWVAGAKKWSPTLRRSTVWSRGSVTGEVPSRAVMGSAPSEVGLALLREGTSGLAIVVRMLQDTLGGRLEFELGFPAGRPRGLK